MIKSEFTSSCFRGINQNSFVVDDRIVISFFKEFKANSKRDDNRLELSIFWNDDTVILSELLNLKKITADDSLQYPFGVAEIHTWQLKAIKLEYPNQFDFERNPINDDSLDNQLSRVTKLAHGNILLDNFCDKAIKQLIQAQLCWKADISKL